MSQTGSRFTRAALAGARRKREGGRALELFQLAFLEVATSRNALPLDEFVLKGGANLRFFYGSPRRSVDMDFNYIGPRARLERFADRVQSAFESAALETLLRSRELEVVELRRHKQSETTRRWKFNLNASGVLGEPSKVEFSTRDEDVGHADDFELAALDAEIARRSAAHVVRLARYGTRAAIAQKIGALRHRSTTEPRDVFDLDHLLTRHPAALAEVEVPPAHAAVAAERAMELGYADYESAVVPYLQEELVDVYGTADAWARMQANVVERLLACGASS